MAEDDGARECAEAINEACVGEINGRSFFDEPLAAQIIREYRDREVAAALEGQTNNQVSLLARLLKEAETALDEQAGHVERLRAALAHYADEDTWSAFPPLPEDDLTWYNPPGDANGYEVARAALGAAPGRGTEEGANGGG